MTTFTHIHEACKPAEAAWRQREFEDGIPRGHDDHVEPSGMIAFLLGETTEHIRPFCRECTGLIAEPPA